MKKYVFFKKCSIFCLSRLISSFCESVCVEVEDHLEIEAFFPF